MSDPADAAESHENPPAPDPVKPRTPGSKPEFRRYVWQRRWFQTLLAALVIFLVLSYVVPGVLGMLYAVRSVLVPVLIGLALAYIVNPVLRFAEFKLRVGRLAGTISLMLLALVVVMIVMVTAVPTMYHQGGELIKTVQEAYPRYVDKLLAQMEPSEASAVEGDPDSVAIESPESAGVDHDAEPVTPDEPVNAMADAAEVATDGADIASAETAAEDGDGSLVDRFINPDRNRQLLELSVERLRGLDGSVVAGWVMQSLDVGVGLVGSAVSFTSYLALSAVVVAFCFFFFSWKFDAMLKWFDPFIPRSHHDLTIDMLKKMDQAVSSFVRGRVIQSLVMMVLLIIGWWLAGVPYWFLLGVLTGLMNLVPFLPAVGWILALILTVMTALANGGDFTLGLILWPSVAYFAAQGLDGWVVEPLVQGQATNLDPLTVMLVVLVGGTLAGLLGMLLAIPLAACVKILSREWLLPKLRDVAADT
ncbi:MAG: AI-2E family transporter [Planctomycetota bacterium]